MVPVYLLLLASAAAGQAPGRPHILSIIVDECARLESADAVSAEGEVRGASLGRPSWPAHRLTMGTSSQSGLQSRTPWHRTACPARSR